MEQIEEYLKPVIDILPEDLREFWLVIYGTAALIILLPLAWYQRHRLRALIPFPRRPVVEPPKLDEDLTGLAPAPGPTGGRRLFIEGVPARLRMVVVAPLGKGASFEESAIPELLDQVRWGLAALARQDQAALRVWPAQFSAHGFPAVFFRHLHRAEPDGQPSHWVLLAGPTPPRPRSVLLGLALWTDAATAIGHLIMDPSQWMKTLQIETRVTEGAEASAALEPPGQPLAEAPGMQNDSPMPWKTEDGPAPGGIAGA
jgi:hypothetical protein